MRLFDMPDPAAKGKGEPPKSDDSPWKPLTVDDIWRPFVHCMMTVLDENQRASKYYRLELGEYYEWLGRIAMKWHEYQVEDESKRASRPD